MERRLVKILGYNVDTFSAEESIEYITKHYGQVITINPEMISNALKTENFTEVLNSAELVIPDSVGVELGLKILGHKVPRIPGIEFGKKLLSWAESSGKKVALVGAKPEILQGAIKNLQEEMKNLNIVYSHDGYFKEDDIIKQEIIAANPDMLLVALGSPKQEIFISDLKEKLPETVMIGLGGSFDVWSGVVQRAPEIYQKLGLEWLYRTVTQPKRFKRIFPTLPIFVLRVLKERLLGK